jgi:hypothetical protein
MPANDPSAEAGRLLARIARRSEPGSRPVALEMSRACSRIAPGFGALLESEIGGAHPDTPVSGTSWSRRHAFRYV